MQGIEQCRKKITHWKLFSFFHNNYEFTKSEEQ
jgi:hypothetical protein